MYFTFTTSTYDGTNLTTVSLIKRYFFFVMVSKVIIFCYNFTDMLKTKSVRENLNDSFKVIAQLLMKVRLFFACVMYFSAIPCL